MPAPAVHGGDAELEAGARSREAGLQPRGEFGNGETTVEAREIEPTYFVLAQAPQVLGAGVPEPDSAVGAHDDHSTAEARQDRAEEPVELVHLVAAQPDLFVDGVELVVRRLQLLVHRFELF